jgi:hypothetical protein
METAGTYPFFVEYEGIRYQCKRIVEGKKVLYQTIHVCGIDFEEDGPYGPNKNPPETMVSNAKLIAREIIRKSPRKVKN